MKYIGIDIGGTNLKAGLVDGEGRLLATRKMKVAGIADPAALAWTIHALVQDLCRDDGCDMGEIFSVGVGCPGAVEIRGGSILYTCNLPLRNVPLRRLFHQLSDLPLYIENDANCAALAEYYVGGGRGSKRFITVTLGTSVGGGIIHNGKIFHGSNGMAGEVGHMSIQMDGEECPCGRRGCWPPGKGRWRASPIRRRWHGPSTRWYRICAATMAVIWARSSPWAWAVPARWRSGAAPFCIPVICPCGMCRCGGCSTSSATCRFT